MLMGTSHKIYSMAQPVFCASEKTVEAVPAGVRSFPLGPWWGLE